MIIRLQVFLIEYLPNSRTDTCRITNLLGEVSGGDRVVWEAEVCSQRKLEASRLFDYTSESK
jgi:hypothetical protein